MAMVTSWGGTQATSWGTYPAQDLLALPMWNQDKQEYSLSVYSKRDYKQDAQKAWREWRIWTIKARARQMGK